MTLSPACWSSVSKKLITGITGLGLVLFVIAHLTGNLTLLLGPEAFNAYAHFLHSLFHGWFVYIADLGLIVFFAAHAVAGLHVWYKRRKARPQRYAVRGSAGGPSRRTLASSTMALSGLFLLVFLIFHVQHFKDWLYAKVAIREPDYGGKRGQRICAVSPGWVMVVEK